MSSPIIEVNAVPIDAAVEKSADPSNAQLRSNLVKSLNGCERRMEKDLIKANNLKKKIEAIDAEVEKANRAKEVRAQASKGKPDYSYELTAEHVKPSNAIFDPKAHFVTRAFKEMGLEKDDAVYAAILFTLENQPSITLTRNVVNTSVLISADVNVQQIFTDNKEATVAFLRKLVGFFAAKKGTVTLAEKNHAQLKEREEAEAEQQVAILAALERDADAMMQEQVEDGTRLSAEEIQAAKEKQEATDLEAGVKRGDLIPAPPVLDDVEMPEVLVQQKEGQGVDDEMSEAPVDKEANPPVDEQLPVDEPAPKKARVSGGGSGGGNSRTSSRKRGGV